MTNKHITTTLFSLLFFCASAQENIELPFEKIHGISYESEESEYYSDAWKTTAVSNTSVPTLEVFRPSSDKNTGTAVIVAPGGGLYAHSINSEGRDVANWLVSRGITAFVLKYRLVPTKKDGTVEIGEEWGADYQQVIDKVNTVLPFSIQDGLNGVKHIRENAETYGVFSDKIGFMGFSAGGAVTMGVGYEYSNENRPDFLVPVYPWTDAKKVETPPSDAPPMMIICATDDGIGLAQGAVELYLSYFENDKNVALHMYSKGDHGFGMRTQGLPSDTWIERVYEWMLVEELVTPKTE
jgi:acetyl esterase/lipase